MKHSPTINISQKWVPGETPHLNGPPSRLESVQNLCYNIDTPIIYKKLQHQQQNLQASQVRPWPKFQHPLHFLHLGGAGAISRKLQLQMKGKMQDNTFSEKWNIQVLNWSASLAMQILLIKHSNICITCSPPWLQQQPPQCQGFVRVPFSLHCLPPLSSRSRKLGTPRAKPSFLFFYCYHQCWLGCFTKTLFQKKK